MSAVVVTCLRSDMTQQRQDNVVRFSPIPKIICWQSYNFLPGMFPILASASLHQKHFIHSRINILMHAGYAEQLINSLVSAPIKG